MYILSKCRYFHSTHSTRILPFMNEFIFIWENIIISFWCEDDP